MPISVGEVNATLRFNVIANSLAEAQANLKALQEQFRATGETAAGLSPKLKETASEMDNLDRLATRMAERMAIAFAVREIFGFIENLYVAAEAMEALHTRTGISVETLQVWERVGRSANVSAEGMGKAIDFLQKTLAKVTPETAESLDRIGLSFGKIAGMSPDQRLVEIITRIGELPTQFQRDSEAIKLFGTDAIEPLAKNYETLAKAAKAGGFPSESDVSLLATGAKGWKDLKDATSDYATMFFGLAIKAVDYQVSPFIALITGGPAAAAQRIHEILTELGLIAPLVEKFNSSTIVPMASHGPSGPAGSEFIIPGHVVREAGMEAGDTWGETFVAELEKKVTEISPRLSNRLSRLENMGQLTLQNAVEAGATPDQFRAYVEIRKTLHEQLVQQEIDLKNVDVELMNNYSATARVIQLHVQESQADYGTRAQIERLKAEDAAEKQIAKTVFEQLTSEKDRMRVLDDYGKLHETITKQIIALERELTKETNTQLQAEIEAKAKLMALYGLTLAGGNIPTSPFAKFQDDIDKVRRENPGQDTTQREQLIIKEFLDAEKAAADAASGLGQSLNNATNAVRIGTTTFTEAFGIASHMLTFSLSAAWSDPTARLNGTVPQPRAMGGPVNAGMPYLVGDGGGPELFVPNRNGTIMPFGSGGGSTVIHLNVAGVWDPATVRSMADMIGTAMMKRSGRQFGSA